LSLATAGKILGLIIKGVNMDKKKKSMWNLLNPMTWIDAVLGLLMTIFSPILRLFGRMPAPNTEAFENIQTSDIDDVDRLAKQQQAAADAMARGMSPAEVVRLYARADAAGRATMDLSALDITEQDWLLRLSDDDLVKLSMSTTAACARSLKARSVKPAFARPRPAVEVPEILKIPSAEEAEEAKRQVVAARFRELVLTPGANNTNTYIAADTLH
jgi:hypothetical protein